MKISDQKLEELFKAGREAGFGPGEIASAVYNILGFATNGTNWTNRITEEQTDTLIKVFNAHSSKRSEGL